MIYKAYILTFYYNYSLKFEMSNAKYMRRETAWKTIFQSKAERIVLVENPGPFLVYPFIRTGEFDGEAK